MARKLLTAKREKWAKGQKPSTIKGKDLALPAGVAERYRTKLERITDEMTATTQREMLRLFKHPDVQEHLDTMAPMQTGMDMSPASQVRILTNDLKSRFEQLFARRAKPMAESMANQADAASKAATYESLKKLSGGLSLKTDIFTGPMDEFFKATVANNVALIKSIPSEYFMKVQNAVTQSITAGKGLEDLTKFFEEQHGVEKRRAKNIAIDQTHKAYNGLNKGRMQGVGIKAFQWQHSGGGLHPRPMHLALSGQVFTFDKLPVIDEDGTRGIPGQAINCRCTMIPVVQFEDGAPK